VSGYHTKSITRGVYGEVSKIREELEELEDAEAQGVTILALCEMSDLYGALEAAAQRYNVSMLDLQKMSDLTKKAFQDGTRSQGPVPVPGERNY
jgi:hypothetical protein